MQRRDYHQTVRRHHGCKREAIGPNDVDWQPGFVLPGSSVSALSIDVLRGCYWGLCQSTSPEVACVRRPSAAPCCRVVMNNPAFVRP